MQHVVAAQAGQGGGHGLDDANGAPHQRAVVAQHQIVSGAGADGVAAATGNDDIAAIAQGQRVIAGRGVGLVVAAQPRQDPAGVFGAAVVTDHQIGAGTGADGIAAAAGDHDVVAAAHRQLVVAAQCQVGGLQQRQHARAGPVDLAVVAQHQVGARATDHRVATGTGQHDVGAVAGRDAVGAAAGVAHEQQAALELLQRRSAVEVAGFAAVAQQQVVAAAGRDRVGPGTTHHQVVAVTDLDVVVAAEFGQGRGEGGKETVAVPEDLAVVTQHHVVALASAHGVGAHAAQHQVVAGAGLQRVARLARAGRRQVQRDGTAQPARAGQGAAVGRQHDGHRRVEQGDVPASRHRAADLHLPGTQAGQAFQRSLQLGRRGGGGQRALLLAIGQLVAAGLAGQQQPGAAALQRGTGVVCKGYAGGVVETEEVDLQGPDPGADIGDPHMADADAGEALERALYLAGRGVAVEHDRFAAVGQPIGAQRVADGQHAALQRSRAGQHAQGGRCRRIDQRHQPLAARAHDGADLGVAAADAREGFERGLDRGGIGVPGQQGALAAVGQHIVARLAKAEREAGLDADRRAPGQRGVVADQHVIAGPSGERVVAEAAHQDVAAGAAKQGVVAALGNVERADEAQPGEALDRRRIALLAFVADEHDGHAGTADARGIQHVVALVTVHHQQALRAAAGEVGHRHAVVAGVAVQRGDVVGAQAVDADHVIAGAGPDADAVAEGAAAGAVADLCRRQARQCRGAQAHRRVGQAGAEVAHAEGVDAAAGVQRQRAAHGIERVGARRPLRRHHADAEHVVARSAQHRGGGGGAGAGDSERVGTRAEAQAQGFDALVVDAVLARGQHGLAGQGRAVDGLDRHGRLAALEGDDEGVAVGRAAMPADRHVLRARLARVGVVRVQDRLQQRQQLVGRGGGRDVVGPLTQNAQPERAAGTGAQTQGLHLVGVVRRRAAVAPAGDPHLDAGIEPGRQRVDRAHAAVPEQLGQVLPGQIAGEGDGVGVAELVDLHTAGHAEQAAQRRAQRIGRQAVVQHDAALQPLGVGAAQHLAPNAQGELAADRAHRDHLLLGGRGHAQAAERVFRQQAGAVVRVGRVIDAQGVAALAAVQRQQARDLVHAVRGAGHDEAVGAFAGVDERVARHRLDLEQVAAAAAQDRRAAGVGGQDGEGVVAAAQLDADGLEAFVVDAALQRLAADHRVRAHAQAVNALVGQPADVLGRAVGVADVEHIHLQRLVHAQVGVQRRKVVVGAHRHGGARRGPIAGEHHRVVAHGGVVGAAVVHLARQAAQRFFECLAGQRGVAEGAAIQGAAIQGEAVQAAALPRVRHLRYRPGIAAGRCAGDAASTGLDLGAEVGAAADLHRGAAGHRAPEAGLHQRRQLGGHHAQVVGRLGAVAEVDTVERQRPVLQVGHRALEQHAGGAVGAAANDAARRAGEHERGAAFALDGDCVAAQRIGHVAAHQPVRGGVQHLELVAEVVDARVEAGHLATHRVHMGGVRVAQAALAGAGCGGGNAAIDGQVVGLAGQQDRVVGAALGGGTRAAVDHQRPANRVHPLLVERHDDLHVAAVAHVVVDAVDGDRLRHLPAAAGAGGEAQLRRDDHAAGAGQLAADPHGAGHCHGVAVRPVDGDHPAASAGAVVGPGVDVQAQRLGHVRQALAVQHSVADRRGSVQRQLPDLALTRLAGQRHGGVGLQPRRAAGTGGGAQREGGAVVTLDGERSVAHRDGVVGVGHHQLQRPRHVDQAVVGTRRVGVGHATQCQGPGLACDGSAAQFQRGGGHRQGAPCRRRADAVVGAEGRCHGAGGGLAVGLEQETTAALRTGRELGVGTQAQEAARPAQIGQQAGRDARQRALGGRQVGAGDGVAGGVRAIDGQHPGLVDGRVARQLDGGLRRGHRHLHAGVAAEVAVRIEAQLGVEGVVGLGQHVDHAVGQRVAAQHHGVAVGLLHVVADIGHAVAELELAGAVQRGAQPAIERVDVGPGVVGGDQRVLAQAGSVHHGQCLADEVDGVAVGRMRLHRHVQLVRGAGVHARRGLVGEVGVVVEIDPRTHHQAIGAGMGEARVDERVGRIQAAGIADQPCAALVDPDAGGAAARHGECAARVAAARHRLQPQEGRGLEVVRARDPHRLEAEGLPVEHRGRHLHRPAAAAHAGVVDVEEGPHAAIAGLRTVGREAGEPGVARVHPDEEGGGVGRAGDGVRAAGGGDLCGQLLRQFGQRRVGIGRDAVLHAVERDLQDLAGVGPLGGIQHHGGRGVESARLGRRGVAVRRSAQLAGAVDLDLGAVGVGQHQVTRATAGRHRVQGGQRGIAVVVAAHMGDAVGARREGVVHAAHAQRPDVARHGRVGGRVQADRLRPVQPRARQALRDRTGDGRGRVGTSDRGGAGERDHWRAAAADAGDDQLAAHGGDRIACRQRRQGVQLYRQVRRHRRQRVVAAAGGVGSAAGVDAVDGRERPDLARHADAVARG